MTLRKKWVLMLTMFFVHFAAFSQVDEPGSGSLKNDSAALRGGSVHFDTSSAKSLLNPKTYLLVLSKGVSQEFTKPFHLKGEDWKKFGIFAAGTGALFAVDQPVQQAALRLRERSTTVRDISHYVTDLGGVYEGFALAGLAGYGLISKDKKMVTTTLLASQAYITGAVVVNVLKFLTGETRPSYYRADQVATPRFLGPFTKAERDANGKKTYSSFPSGHTTVAFGVATVFASEYRDKPLIPVLAYTVASLIGISRVTENAHWTTDVFVGAALGYLTGKNMVNNYHHFAKTSHTGRLRNAVSFHLQYNSGHFEPGLIYQFRK